MKNNIKTLIIVFITAIVTAFATNIVNLVFQARSYNLEQERNSAILYYDIKDGIDAIKMGSTLPGMLDNSYSVIYKDYFKYVSYLRPKLKEKDTKTIRTYYKNIKLLEQSRLNYLANKDDEVLKSKYRDILNAVNLSLKQMNIEETLNVLREKAKIDSE